MFCFRLFVAILIASSNLPEALCFEKTRIEHHGQIFEQEYETEKEEAGIQFAAAIKSNGNLQDDNHMLFPRQTDLPKRWHPNFDQQVSNGLHIPEKFDLDQVPTVFRRIAVSCLESKNEDHPSDTEVSKCIIDTALKTFPPNSYFKAARTVAFDLLRRGNGIYTTKSLLGMAVNCKELAQNIHSRKTSSVSNCFFHSLVQMHPLKGYAIVAIQNKANNFFEHIATVCHNEMPKNLKGNREIKKYYSQCFIDRACAKYSDNFLVEEGRQWLTPYINHPDSKFNQDKIIDIAEFCEEKTEKFPADKKSSSAFFCFFRSLLSLHSQTKKLADNLIKQKATHPQKTEQEGGNHLKTPLRNHSPKKPNHLESPVRNHSPKKSNHLKSPVRNHSPKKFNHLESPERHESPRKSTEGYSPSPPRLSKSASRLITDAFTPSNQQITNPGALAECMLKAATSLPIASQAASTVTSYLGSIPKIGGFMRGKSPETTKPLAEGPRSTMSQEQDTLQSFVEAATSCSGLFKREKNGKLVLDQSSATNAAVEVIKLHPMGAFVLGSAEAITENVSVTQDGEGKTQYKINYTGLATGLGKAAVKSTKFGQIATKFIQ